MKKKGLIIATIVMVLVLAVSLTTATYAWFAANSTTSIEGFTVSITSNNAVNIGVDKDSQIATSSLSVSNFYTGSVEYTNGDVAGKLGGSWGGTSAIEGLSATLDHDILWGAQSKAVAALRGDNGHNVNTVKGDYVEIGTALTTYGDTYSINAANLDSSDTTGATLTNVTTAKANKNTSNTGNVGDYVYLVLGVQPNGSANLATHNLCIAVDFSEQTGATLGVLTALHVAYRVTKADEDPTEDFTDGVWNATATTGDWEDVEIFTSQHYNTTKSSVVTNITNGTASTPDYAKAYQDTYGTAPTNGQYMMAINDLSTTIGVIDQIELIIYLDGNDLDCRQEGTTNISGALKIFFCTTVNQVASGS